MGTSVSAQTWLIEPKIQVCENFISCDDERHIELTQSELNYVKSVLLDIPSGANEAAVTKHFGWQPINRSPTTEGAIGKWRGPMYRLTFGTKSTTATTADSHVDLYFINGRAYLLKWWFNDMRKMVQLTFVE